MSVKYFKRKNIANQSAYKENLYALNK